MTETQYSSAKDDAPSLTLDQLHIVQRANLGACPRFEAKEVFVHLELYKWFPLSSATDQQSSKLEQKCLVCPWHSGQRDHACGRMSKHFAQSENRISPPLTREVLVEWSVRYVHGIVVNATRFVEEWAEVWHWVKIKLVHHWQEEFQANKVCSMFMA